MNAGMPLKPPLVASGWAKYSSSEGKASPLASTGTCQVLVLSTPSSAGEPAMPIG
jgi:hypothetical protein